MVIHNNDFREFINDKVWDYLPPSKVRVGNEIHVRCPICGDSKKNSRKKRGYFYLLNGSYFCFNCGASMSGMQLLKVIAGQNYEEIVQEYRRLKIKNGGESENYLSSQMMDLSSLNNQLSAISYINSLQSAIKPEWKNPLTEDAKKYLEKRKVLDAPFLHNKFYSIFDSKQNEYILIPWTLNGIDAYYQINDFEHHDKNGRKYIFPSHKEKLIYGLDNIDISFPYVICFEGVYDSLFIPNAVATGGKNLTSLQQEILRKRYPHHQIVLSYDNDEPGLTAMAKQIKQKPAEFKYFKWFDETTKEKDINEFILKENNVNVFSNKENIKKMIVGSIAMKLFLIEKGLWN